MCRVGVGMLMGCWALSNFNMFIFKFPIFKFPIAHYSVFQIYNFQIIHFLISKFRTFQSLPFKNCKFPSFERLTFTINKVKPKLSTLSTFQFPQTRNRKVGYTDLPNISEFHILIYENNISQGCPP